MSKTNDTSYDVAATSERELTEADLALVSGGTPSLSYGRAVFTYTPQSGGGGEGPETVTIWGIVMTVPQPK